MSVVLITGGSRGIGAEMVRRFSRAGHKVAFTYKNSKSAAETLAHETSSLPIFADSASPHDITAAVKCVSETLGAPDILVNNAGVAKFALTHEMSLEEWQNVLAVNLTAAFLYSKEVIPAMLHNKFGRIINISSIWGLDGASCEVAYSASKAGLIGFTKSLAQELAPSGITVNAIAPGFIDTEMNGNLTEEEVRDFLDTVPVLRAGTVADVAELAIFLAGSGAGYITGEVIKVAGGL